MRPTRLDQVAKYLIAGYLDTRVNSREFTDEYGSPPSRMTKIHSMRSIVQASLTADPAYDLKPVYSELGRVRFAEVATGDIFQLRSSKAYSIETTKGEQLDLLPGLARVHPAGVQLLVYRFEQHGVTLSIIESVQRDGRRGLIATGEPEIVGFWPYVPDDETDPFDQTGDDSWEEFNDDDETGEGEA